jgi:hypothetical protein
MELRRRRKTDSPNNAVGAGAAGGGVGTIVATFAQSLPDTSSAKAVLLVASPLITVCVSGLWLALKSIYIDPFMKDRKLRLVDRAMERVLANARTNALRALDDPNASPSHKRDMQKIVEDLEKVHLRKITERMNILVIE